MKKPSLDRIEEIFHLAVGLPPTERRAFVAKECGGDPDCERLVNSYLEADASASNDILGSPVGTLFPDQDDIMETKIAGRYVIEKELGHGGMSQVYLARDENLKGEAVVIKVLAHELVQDRYAQQKFDQEVEALLRIRERGIVEVRDAGKLDDGRPYIVMQYIDGETLASQIPTEGMNLKRAASILKQIGAALEHVHGNNVFHRDLKPANIMVKRGSDTVVLIDFGIAKVLGSAVAPNTVDGSSAGTVPYMSPEQLRAEEVTAASDIYSMAVVAYEMVTGRRPFNASSAGQLIDFQRKGVRVMPSALRPGISKSAEAIILRGLSFDPKDRYQSAKAFGDDLAAALLHEEVKGKRWTRRQWIAAVAAVIIVSLLSYAIYQFIKDGPPPPSKGFDYWLDVQTMRDGKEYGEPYKSNGGDDTFDAGDKFQLNVQSLEPGYIYVFNEGYSNTGDVSFTRLYPTQSNGSTNIGANQTIQFDWITFSGPAGAENVWIVWSASPVSELESASGPNLVKVKDFLQKQVKGDVRKYKKGDYATVRAKSDLVLTLAQFKHR